MKLSSRSDYAAKAMLELSMSPDHPVTLAYLAHTQNISISYLEQIFALLRKHELVRSVRGPGGGYTLNKPPNEISVGDIVKAIDFSSSAKGQDTHEQHPPSGKPESKHLWSQLSQLVYDFLSSVTLEDIHNADQSQKKNSSDDVHVAA